MSNTTTSVYLGNRGNPFKDLITRFLQRGKLRPKYINTLTNTENMKLYGKAFTAASANATENYEIYEQLGDISANKFIVWYAYRRFPQLSCPKGVKVVARLHMQHLRDCIWREDTVPWALDRAEAPGGYLFV